MFGGQLPEIPCAVRIAAHRDYPGFDYREVGACFITIYTHQKECVLGEVDSDEVDLSRVGLIARDEWLRTLEMRPYIEHVASVVMPNHVHLLFGLWTDEDGEWDPGGRRDTMHGVPTTLDEAPITARNRFGNHGADSVSSIIGTYKAAVTRLARRSGAWGDEPLWQGRYHDRVVRNERERNAFHEYIADNPRRWHEDRFFR